jgi:hypothetical protein
MLAPRFKIEDNARGHGKKMAVLRPFISLQTTLRPSRERHNHSDSKQRILDEQKRVIWRIECDITEHPTRHCRTLEKDRTPSVGYGAGAGREFISHSTPFCGIRIPHLAADN